METDQLKKNFEEQLASTEKQIADLEAGLAKAKEYKLKLVGGLETLELINSKDQEGSQEEPAAE